jgi:hypothetical protein
MGDRFMPGVTHSFARKPRRFRAQFSIAGTADPTIEFPESLAAAGFQSAVHDATGKYVFILANKWPQGSIYEFGASYFPIEEDKDFYTQTIVVPSGDFIALVVRLKTGATNTDPPAAPNGGFLSIWVELESSPRL